MLVTFTRPIAVHTRTLGLVHVSGVYATRMAASRRLPLSDAVELVVTMVIRCDGQRRDLGDDEQITLLIQPHDIMAAQDTRL